VEGGEGEGEGQQGYGVREPKEEEQLAIKGREEGRGKEGR